MKKVIKVILAPLGFWLMSGSAAFAQASGSVTLNEQVGILRKIIDLMVEFFVNYSFRVLGGVIILIIGWIIANFVTNFIIKMCEKHRIDVTVVKFLSSAVKFIVFGFALLIALGKFGVEIAPFIAGLSVVGFGTSFALQGPLSNYAAGASLIFTKPFKVGDIIEVLDVMGEVEDMTLGRTLLRTVDGNHIVIPNKHIIGEIIHNDTEFKKAEIKVGVSYDADVKKAIAVIERIIEQDSRISTKIKPQAGIIEFGDSSVNLFARIWCRQGDYWDVLFNLNLQILEQFKKENIAIPFPQQDVHIKALPEGFRKG